MWAHLPFLGLTLRWDKLGISQALQFTFKTTSDLSYISATRPTFNTFSLTTVKDLESRRFERKPFVGANRGIVGVVGLYVCGGVLPLVEKG